MLPFIFLMTYFCGFSYMCYDINKLAFFTTKIIELFRPLYIHKSHVKPTLINVVKSEPQVWTDTSTQCI